MSTEEKRKGVKQIVSKNIVGVEEMTSQFETNFSMASCLSINIVSSIGWYMGRGIL